MRIRVEQWILVAKIRSCCAKGLLSTPAKAWLMLKTPHITEILLVAILLLTTTKVWLIARVWATVEISLAPKVWLIPNHLLSTKAWLILIIRLVTWVLLVPIELIAQRWSTKSRLIAKILLITERILFSRTRP